MAEYQVVIVSPQGETWDVTERVSTLTAVSYTHLTLPTICSV